MTPGQAKANSKHRMFTGMLARSSRLEVGVPVVGSSIYMNSQDDILAVIVHGPSRVLERIVIV